MNTSIRQKRINVTKSKLKNYHEYLRERGVFEEVSDAMSENIRIYHEAKERYQTPLNTYSF